MIRKKSGSKKAKRKPTKKKVTKKKVAKKKMRKHNEPHTIPIAKSKAPDMPVSRGKPCEVNWESADIEYTLTFARWPFADRKEQIKVPARGQGKSGTFVVDKGAAKNKHGYRIRPPAARKRKGAAGVPKPDPVIDVGD